MTAATKRKTGNLIERQKLLVETSVRWLRQARELLDHISDATYATSPRELAPHRVGGHLRHILEFYECFLDGLQSSHIDYDARRRDTAVEKSRQAAVAKIQSILRAIESEPRLREDSIIWVRMEDAEASGTVESFMTSSIGRELQMLSSHTIHHFALIAMTLRMLGHEVDREFGMAPSTLRYLSSQRLAQMPAEAA